MNGLAEIHDDLLFARRVLRGVREQIQEELHHGRAVHSDLGHVLGRVELDLILG